MTVPVQSELQGTIVGVFVEAGAPVRLGQVLALVESMKMHHEITASVAGLVESVTIADGDTVAAGQTLFVLLEGAAPDGDTGRAGTGGDRSCRART